jgi:hypothetical protein
MRLRTAVIVTAAISFLTLAGAQPAIADSGAQKFSCSEVFEDPATTGDVVVTPGGNVNFNCNFPGTTFGGPAQIFDCSTLGMGTGLVIIPPTGAVKIHCSVPPV